MVFYEAMKKVGVERGKIIESIYANSFQGASGFIRFNQEGSSPMMISMFQVKNKKFTLVEPAD